jgi:serine protease AprX
MKVSKKWFSILITMIMMFSILIPTASAKPLLIKDQSLKIEPAYKSELVRAIVHVKGADINLQTSIKLLGGNVLQEWTFIHALLIEIPKHQIEKLAAHPSVYQIQPEAAVNSTAKPNTNGKAKGNTNTKAEATESTNTGYGNAEFDTKVLKNAYNIAVKADKAWMKGYTGKGIGVAVVDSGISSDGKSDFGNRIIKQVKFNSDTNNMADKYGHGTHVAGIIGGDGKNSNGAYVGVAPGVDLINVKFSDDEGRASEADLISALEWISENHEKYNIRVVNISAGVGTKQSYKESAVSAAVELLWHQGIVVVASVGNTGGEECSTCYAPANNPFIISVGAVDDNNTKDLLDDYMKSWSSKGKTLDGHLKPEIVAPGSEIVSYMPSGALRKKSPNNIVEGDYFKMGGTSMAAPVISGVVALMLEAHPEWTPDQVKWVLQNTTRLYGLTDKDAEKAIEEAKKQGKELEYVPGMVGADNAVHYPETPGFANQGLEPHPAFIDPTTGEVLQQRHMGWSHMSWSHMSWAHMSWAHSFDK